MKELCKENLASHSGLGPYAGEGDIAGVASASRVSLYQRRPTSGADPDEDQCRSGNKSRVESGLTYVRFDVATSKHIPGNDYDLVAYFDCLHDMGDPVGAAAHTLQALNPMGP